jgi:hypothetical protein
MSMNAHLNRNRRRSQISLARPKRIVRPELLEKRQLLSCSTPTVQSVRGRDATFDQCFNLEFEHDGEDYEVSAYYTETTTPADLLQCTATENTAGRCEHLLPNDDDGNGDNIHAVSMAGQARDAFKFFLDRGLKFLPAGETELEVYIAEDPRGGGVPTANSLLTDDELVADPDLLWEELLAYHELHHLVQGQYDGSWDDFYGEGIARSSEDRVRTDLDADTGHLFIPQITNSIDSNTIRTTDLYAQDYDTAAWWTWLWDQYRAGAGENPPVTGANDLGWGAMREFYEELETQQSDELGALADFISAQGSSFRQDFIDYTLALWAQSFNPTDPRLGYLDNEINNIGPMTGHTIINSAPAFGDTTLNLTPRTSRHIEFNPASQCDYTAFSFDGNGKNYGFSVMTADGGNLQDRWTSYSNNWARTVRTADLDRVVGVVTSFDQSGSVDVGRGCVSPDVQIKTPTTSSFAMVGTADNPRSFIVRLSVTGNGAAIAGLVADEFDVTLKKSGSADAPIPVEVINASYVLDDYWLLVQAPDDVAGAETGSFYDLNVTLGGDSDSENFSVVYLERVQDVMLVLDRSGSMGGDTGKIEAARNAANLLVMALADEDQGGYVAFDTDAEVQVSLDELSDGNQRQDLEDAIAAEVPLDFTSIGDGLRAALDDYNSNGNPDNLCSIVLMSDGHENEPEYWADVKDDLIAAGCPVHTISFGPGANEVLMQEISGAVSGGSHDYATSEGGVPINSVLGWENNVSRIYENKATQMAGRQRIFTVLGDSALGGVATGIIDFEDHPTGTVITVGNSFIASGVPGKGLPFQNTAGGMVNTGFARVDNQQNADGAGHDLQLNNINVGFEFAKTLESASAKFGYFGGNLNVTINGKLFNARTLSLLQGEVIGGVTVSLTMFDNQHGRLDFKGPIDSLALGGQEFWIDDLRFNSEVGNFHEIPVDKGADILVVSAAWQEKMGGVHTELFDPNDDPVPVGRRSLSSQGTNEVWRVPDPIPGTYRMRLMNIPQEYFMTASVRSEFELYTFVGQPQEDMLTGVEVPLVASFISNEGPVLDANVTATVMDPGGTSKVVKLWDDGNHGDGEADDGVYANRYTATSFGDVVQLNPDLVVEGNEPLGVGSYQVTFKAKKDDVVREGLGSFVLNRDQDSDGDGLPDRWEEEHGLDPKNRADGNTDFDKDGLPASCEYRVGTDPRNSDTDDGGRSDGAEVQFVPGQLCRAVRDPLDPADDRIRKVTGIVALPAATPNGAPLVRLKISIPDDDYLFSSIHRRPLNEDGRPIGDWIELEKQFRGPEFEDFRMNEGNFEYQIIPFYFGGEGNPPVEGQHVLSSPVVAKKDPYAPFGSVMIDDADDKTYSPLVTLHIIADDSGHVHDFDPVHQPAPGSPLEKLKMKISNRADFAGADWQPFQPVVKDWFLGRFEPLQETTRWVYVAFMDEAGNVSEGPIADSIRVLLQPGDTYPFDGKVNIADLNNVRNNFGRQGPVAILIGDAIGALNGVVDISDLNAVRNNFGSSVDAPVATSARRPAPVELADEEFAGVFFTSPSTLVAAAPSSNAAARDALFGRFTGVGVEIDSLVTAHWQSQKRGLRAAR